jgi:transposase InsO family protein
MSSLILPRPKAGQQSPTLTGPLRRAHLKAITAVAFLGRARGWFAARGITGIERIVTDNGACYRAGIFGAALAGSCHQRITPYTPRHKGNVESFNSRIRDECLNIDSLW